MAIVQPSPRALGLPDSEPTTTVDCFYSLPQFKVLLLIWAMNLITISGETLTLGC